MSDRLSDVEVRLRQLDETVVALCRRLERLEHPPDSVARAGIADAPVVSAFTAGFDTTGWVSLVGRTFVILGGAFLLRALTESGRVPEVAGVGLGFLYAMIWLGAAEYMRSDRSLTRAFHGLAALLVGLPLLWEAAARFQVLDAPASAMALCAVSALGLAVAAHRRLRGLALAATTGTIVTLFALALTTGRPMPYVAPALMLAAATWWLGESRQWPSLRWLAGLSLDLFLFGLINAAIVQPPRESPAVVLIVLVMVMVIVLGLFVVKALVRQRVSSFEAVQTALLLTLGVGGAAMIAPTLSESGAVIVGCCALVIAGFGYAVPFAAGAARRSRATVHYFSSISLALLLAGLFTLLRGPAESVALVVAAVLIAGAGARWNLPLWRLQSIILTGGAMISAGFSAVAFQLWQPGAASWPAPDAIVWLPAAAAVFAVVIDRLHDDRAPTLTQYIARIMLTTMAVAAAATALLWGIGGPLLDRPVDAGELASLKTTVLALIATLLMASRRRLGVEAGWLAGAALAFGGVELLVEGLWVATPSRLFVALAAYGAALIATSRATRSAARPRAGG
jgi:hypothetical protein